MDYKITKLNQIQIYDFLLETDQSFIPKPISTRVNLKDYALKLASHATFFVCIKKEKLIGVIACYLNDKTKKKAFVSLISVLPKYQGKGIGQKLTKLCDEEAMKLGFAEIETEIHIKNKPSIAMYKKGGYSLNRRANNSLFLCKRLIEYNMGEKIPLVSICMITYNHESYIRKAIEGVLIQKTTFPIQLVIGEDCSSDNTRNICKEYLQKNQDIIVLLERESNLGMQENASATLNACIGKYIAMCEGDDYWTDPLKLQKQVDFLEENEEYSISHHRYNIISTSNNVKTLSPIMEIDSDIYGILSNHRIGTLSCVFKNDKNKHNYNWLKEFKIGDFPMHVSNALNGKIRYFTDIMATYRIHEDGNWNSRTQINKIETAIEVLSKTLSTFELNQEANSLLNLSLAKQHIRLAHIHIVNNETNKASDMLKKALLYNHDAVITELIVQIKNNINYKHRKKGFKDFIKNIVHFIKPKSSNNCNTNKKLFK